MSLLEIQIWVIAVIVILSVIIYFTQEYFLFLPEKLPKDFRFQYENQGAAKIASDNNPRMLILACPYYSLTSNIKRYLPMLPVKIINRFAFPTYQWIKKVNCPIKIIHGTKDRPMPFKSGLKLAAVNHKWARLYPIIGGGHKNLHNFEEYHRYLKGILESKLPVDIDRKNTSIDFVRRKRKKNHD